MYSLWLMFSCLCIIYHHGIAKPFPSDVECVDIYKQPTLQDPSMKNYRIPKFALQSMLESNERNIENIVSETIMKCPKGQVPIHRPVNNITDDFIHSEYHLSNPGRVLAQQKPGSYRVHSAIISIRTPPKRKFTGGQAIFGICTPKLIKDQLSFATIFIGNHKGNDFIQYGWMVNPNFYGNDIPRLTLRWKKGSAPLCYNANCKGYVQTHDRLHLGMPMTDIPKVLFVHMPEIPLSIDLLHGSDQWTVTVGTAVVGHFPKLFLSELQAGATRLNFGGTAAYRGPVPSPPMGSGAFPTKDYKASCYMKALQFSGDIHYEDIDPKSVTVGSDRPKCYGINYLNYLGNVDRQTIAFGGPGGQCN